MPKRKSSQWESLRDQKALFLVLLALFIAVIYLSQETRFFSSAAYPSPQLNHNLSPTLPNTPSN